MNEGSNNQRIQTNPGTPVPIGVTNLCKRMKKTTLFWTTCFLLGPRDPMAREVQEGAMTQTTTPQMIPMTLEAHHEDLPEAHQGDPQEEGHQEETQMTTYQEYSMEREGEEDPREEDHPPTPQGDKELDPKGLLP